MDDMFKSFRSWEEKLNEESEKADEEKFEMFLKNHFDVPVISELFKVIGKDTVISWIEQFEDEEDQNTAFSILQRIKYFSSNDVMYLCQLNYCDWIIDNESHVDSTLFIPVGDAGKSGSMIAYLFRMANSIPKNSFLSLEGVQQCGAVFDERITDIVLLDDYSGTGDQFLNDETLQLLIKNARGKIRISFLPVVISMQAYKRIQDTVEIKIYCHQIRSDREYNDRERALIKRYSKGLFVHHNDDLRFGWGGLAETIAFFYNVPNNSLPIIWSCSYSEETKENWKPLFPRVNPNGDNEIEQLFSYIIQREVLISEDYTLYIRVFTEVYIQAIDGRIRLSFQELTKMIYSITTIMYPYNMGIDYQSPFIYLQTLRKKLLGLIKSVIYSSDIPLNELMDFYTVDYPVVDQGCLIRYEYTQILSDYIISKSIELSDLAELVNKEMDDSKRLVYIIEGFMNLVSAISKKRSINSNEYERIKYIRSNGMNETIKYWISKKITKDETKDDINEDNVFILVNNYGKYQVWTLNAAKEFNLI